MKFLSMIFCFAFSMQSFCTEDNNIIKWISALGSGITIVKGGYDFFNLVRKTFYPTENEKNLEKITIHALKKIRVEREFNECLVNHASDIKNKSGIPCACEEVAQLFAKTAGIKAYNQMKDEYSEYLDLHKTKGS